MKCHVSLLQMRGVKKNVAYLCLTAEDSERRRREGK